MSEPALCCLPGDAFWVSPPGRRRQPRGGPTRDTAFKSISLNNIGMNAMTAPGWYSPTLEEAAAAFTTRRGAPPP